LQNSRPDWGPIGSIRWSKTAGVVGLRRGFYD
jgi:hypothetical protein